MNEETDNVPINSTNLPVNPTSVPEITTNVPGPSSDIAPFDPFTFLVDCGDDNCECILLFETMKSIKRWSKGMKDLIQVDD